MSNNIRIPDINLVVIAGRLTRDPEVRYTAGGRAVSKIRIANSRRFRNPTTNEWQEEATFVDVTLWGEMAERTKERLKKGIPVLVEGRLQSESWEAKDGAKRSTLKITARRMQILESAASVSPEAEAPPAEVSYAADEAPTAGDMEEVVL